jgi:hypothetical protein
MWDMIQMTSRWLVGGALSALLLVAPALGQDTGSSSGTAKEGSKPAASTPTQAGDGSTGKVVEVTVTGKGATPQEAFDDAIRTALRQVAGTFVRHDSKVQGDQLVEDRIITHSQGFIEKATQQGAASSTDGVYEQKAIVIVRVGKVEEVFDQSAVSSTEVDGDSLAAKVRSLREQRASAGELLAAVFEGFPANVMDCEIAPECTGDRLKPSTPPSDGERVRLGDDQIFVLLKVDVWVNEQKWKAWAKAAEDVFKAVAVGGHTIKTNAKKAGARKLTKGLNSDHDSWITRLRPWMSEAWGRAEHLAWELQGGLKWFNLILEELSKDLVSTRTITGDSLKDGEVSQKDVFVIAITPSMGSSSFSSYAIPRSAFRGAFQPIGQDMEVNLNLLDADGDSIGTMVPFLGTGREGGRITTDIKAPRGNPFASSGATGDGGRPWVVAHANVARTEFWSIVLVPMLPMSTGYGDYILCSRLTIPIGVILTEQELASLTKVESQVVGLIPNEREQQDKQFNIVD